MPPVPHNQARLAQRNISDFFGSSGAPASKRPKVSSDGNSPAASDGSDGTGKDARSIASPHPPGTANIDDVIGTLDGSWLSVLRPEFKKPSFTSLQKFLASEYAAKKKIFPPTHQIFSWSHLCPFNSVKVVIIGQDPYHNDGQAHGLCFSVPKGVVVPPSLVNIYQELERDVAEFKRPGHGCLEGWARQGVLLLNATLTVRAHEPASHAGKGWEEFTDAAIMSVNNLKRNVVFMLWGSHAQKKGCKIDQKRHLVLKAVHPSPLSAHRGFIGCGHFSKANHYLASHSLAPIDWNSL